GLAESIGLASMNDDQFGSHIDSVAGGLFCTLLTGFLLMCPAAFFGAGYVWFSKTREPVGGPFDWS
ncbi:MAG: hypothetical protein AAF802_22420, partial [Planctomycetota bacterium]